MPGRTGPWSARSRHGSEQAGRDRQVAAKSANGRSQHSRTGNGSSRSPARSAATTARSAAPRHPERERARAARRPRSGGPRIGPRSAASRTATGPTRPASRRVAVADGRAVRPAVEPAAARLVAQEAVVVRVGDARAARGRARRPRRPAAGGPAPSGRPAPRSSRTGRGTMPDGSGPNASGRSGRPIEVEERHRAARSRSGRTARSRSAGRCPWRSPGPAPSDRVVRRQHLREQRRGRCPAPWPRAARTASRGTTAARARPPRRRRRPAPAGRVGRPVATTNRSGSVAWRWA